MTVAAIWYEPEDGCLWAAADTRISSDGDTGGTIVRTDHGAKLFPLALICHRFPLAFDGDHLVADFSFRRASHYRTVLGYAFAGDVLPALMTHATVGAFLQNLVVPPQYSANPPRLEYVAEIIRRVGEKFAKDALSATAGRYGAFEAAVFGWCPFSESFLCFHIRPVWSDSNFQLANNKLVMDSDNVLVLGSGAQRFEKAMDDLRSDGDKFGRTRRFPKLAIEALIDEDRGNIGGSLSLGCCNREGFRLFGSVTPIVEGEPPARLAFNGIDLSGDNQWVDQYLIAIDALT